MKNDVRLLCDEVDNENGGHGWRRMIIVAERTTRSEATSNNYRRFAPRFVVRSALLSIDQRCTLLVAERPFSITL